MIHKTERLRNIIIFIIVTVMSFYATCAHAYNSIGSGTLYILGTYLEIDPSSQTVPKNTGTGINTGLVFSQVNDQSISYNSSGLPSDYRIIGELSGPGIDGTEILETPPDNLLLIPPLLVTGTYVVDNIRLEDADGNIVMPANPSYATIDVIEKVMVTQVTSRPLTLEEIEELGIVIGSGNFTTRMFTVGFATESEVVYLDIPLITYEQGEGTINLDMGQFVPDLDIPTLDIKPFEFKTVDPLLPEIEIPPIRGVIVIPGNIAFLNQFFDVALLVSNEASTGANLSLTDTKAEIFLPFGKDNIPNSDDEPLRLAEIVDIDVQPVVSVLNQDNQSDLIGPQELGKGNFIVEGVKEGTHKVNIDITATLLGLPTGPINLKGTAEGVVLVRNPTFNLTFSHPDVVRMGEEYSLYVIASNTSNVDANLVSLSLDPQNAYGATIVSDSDDETDLGVVSFETIAAGDSATAEYRLIARKNGKVTATGFVGEEGLSGVFQLFTGVGDSDIPLSPDTIILPDDANRLPKNILLQATRVLGLAYSVATAPRAALGSNITRTSSEVVRKRAFELSDAGFRIKILEPEINSVEDLLLDWHGNHRPDPGFDEILRTTNAGSDFHQAVSDLLISSMEEGEDILDIQKRFGDVVQHRKNYLSVAVNTPGNSTPAAYMQIIDSSGNILGRKSSESAIISDIPYGAIYDLDANQLDSKSDLAIISNLQSSGYTIQIIGTDNGAIDLGILYFDKDNNLKQALFRNVAVNPQSIFTISYPVTETNINLSIDSDGDGNTDQTISPSETTPYDPNKGPSVISVVQVPEHDLIGRGRVVALLFDEYIDRNIPNDSENFRLSYKDRNDTPQNDIQSFSISENSRFALLTFQNGISPFFEYNLTVKNMNDPQGNPQTEEEITVPVVVRMEDPGGIVYGIVRSGDGSPISTAMVELKEPIETLFGTEMITTYTRTTDASGYYRFDYIKQDKMNFNIFAIDPTNGQQGNISSRISVDGQNLILNISLLGLGSIKGTIVEQDGVTPVPDANVTIKSIANPAIFEENNPNLNLNIQYAKTDDEGKFEVFKIPVGNLSISAACCEDAKKGLISAYLPTAGATEEVTVLLHPSTDRGSVKGRVFWSDGVTGVENAVIIIRNLEQENKKYVDYASSDMDGYFNFDGVPIGKITLEIFTQVTGEEGFAKGHVNAGEETVLNAILSGTATVVGTVYDAQGNPAGGAQVIGGINLVLADENGNFVINNVPLGQQKIVAGLAETSFWGSTTVSIGEPGETVRANVFLEPKGTVTGVVRDHTGDIVEGTKVFLWAKSDAGYISAITDENGIYEFKEIPLGDYTLRVMNSSKTDGDETGISIVTGGQIVNRDLTFRGTGTITGVVLDPDGISPRVSEVFIRRQDFDPYGKLEWIETRLISNLEDENGNTGRFRLDNVLVGDFEIYTYNPFHSNTVTLKESIAYPGETVDIQLILRDSAKIKGQVFLANDEKAQEGIVVTYHGKSERSIVTDTKGKYLLDLIPPERFKMEAYDPVTQNRGITYGVVGEGAEAEIDIHLLGQGRVIVKVQDGDGNPIQNANVSLDSGSLVSSIVGKFPVFKTNTDGTVIFENVPEGAFSVTAEDTLSILGGSSGGIIPEDNFETTVIIILDASGTVKGKVFSADETDTVPFAQLMLRISGKPTFFATTDDKGNYEFKYIPLEDFGIEVLDPNTGRGGKASDGLYYNGEIVELDITLLSQGTVRGKIYSALGKPISSANVKIRSTSILGSMEIQTTSSLDGSYSISGVIEGEFIITATDMFKEISGHSTDIITEEGEIVEVDVTMEPTGTIEGVVFAANGKTTIPYAKLTLDIPSKNYEKSIITDSEGKYSCLYVPIGNFTITAKEQGGNDGGQFSGSLNSAGEIIKADLIFIGTGTIKGHLLNNDESIINQVAEISLTRTGLFNGTYYAYTDEEGYFELKDVPTGEFSISAWLSVDKLSGNYSGYLESEGQILDLKIYLEPSGEVSGRAYQSDGVTAAENALITLRGTNVRGALIMLYGQVNAEGSFLIDNVPLGSFSISAYDPQTGGIGNAQGVLSTQSETVDIGSIFLDDTPPNVIEIYPSNGSVQVEGDTNITISFSEPVNQSTINSSNIKISSPEGKINGTLSVSPDGMIVIFDPSEILPEFSRINLLINKNIQDESGRYLPSNFFFSFTTADTTAPQIIYARLILGTIVVRFSESIDKESGSVVVTNEETGKTIEGVVMFSQNNSTATFTPIIPFPESNEFKVEVSGFTDNFNNQQNYFSGIFSNIDQKIPVILLHSVSGENTVIEGVQVELIAEPIDSPDIYIVDFIVEGQIVETDYEAPFTIIVSPIANTVITARAIDFNGNTSNDSSFTIFVLPNQIPTISITSPSDNSYVGSGNNITIRVEANDDLGLGEIELHVISNIISFTNVYRVPPDTKNIVHDFEFQIPSAAQTDENIQMIATSKDIRGIKSTSSTINLICEDATLPSVRIVSLREEGFEVGAGDIIPITVVATDNVLLNGIGFETSNAVELSDSRHVEPPLTSSFETFDFTVPSNLPGGAQIVITGFATDTSGNKGKSSTITLTVQDYTPPTAEILAPLDGAEFTEGSLQTISVRASDDNKIAKVEFYFNGNLISTDKSPYQGGIYTTSFTAIGNPGDSVTISAKAYDIAENFSEEVYVSVSISSDNTPPTVSFVSNLQTIQFTEGKNVYIWIDVADDVKVDQAKLIVNNVIVDELNSLSNGRYYFSYTVGNLVPEGEENINIPIEVEVIDHKGNVSRTEQVFVAFVPDNPPQVEITKPVDNQDIPGGGTIKIEVKATDDIKVSQIQIVANGQVIATSPSPQTSIEYVVPNSLVGGTLNIEAIAKDSKDQTANTTILLNIIEFRLDSLTASAEKGSPADNTKPSINIGQIVEIYGEGFHLPGTEVRFTRNGGGTVYAPISNVNAEGVYAETNTGNNLVFNNEISTGIVFLQNNTFNVTSGSVDLQIVPVLKSFAVSEFQVGKSAIITGTGFEQGMKVVLTKYDGNSIEIDVISIRHNYTVAELIIPDGAIEGMVYVNTTGGTSNILDNIVSTIEICSLPDTTINVDNTSFDGMDVIIDGCIVTIDGEHYFRKVDIINGGQLTHSSATTTEDYSLEITADNIIVDSTSKIDVDGKGYLGGYSGDNNSLYGRMLGNTTSGGSFDHSGGSYGGLGYKYDNDQVNRVYGNYRNPNELGSGGGGYTGDGHYPGGNGGGLVRINANNITLDGNIFARGESGSESRGAGSGGGIYINTEVLAGNGNISVNGGNKAFGGGGGRVAVYYNDISGFDINDISAYGGDSNSDGGSGTVYLKSSSQEYGDLIVDNNNRNTYTYSTPLRSIGSGTITDLTSTVLTDDNANFPLPNPITGELGLIGLEIDPNINDGNPNTFTIVNNTATTITIDPIDGELTKIAGIGNTYIGVCILDNLFIRGRAKVFTKDLIIVLDELSINGDAELITENCTDLDDDGFFTGEYCYYEMDCNDNNTGIHPGSIEICDGLDNNCNGEIDEGCAETGTLDTTGLIEPLYLSGTNSYKSIYIASGTIVKGFGSEPLRLLSEGDVTIEGKIDIRGGNGQDAANDTTVPALGGLGVAGGSVGGQGGVRGENDGDGMNGFGPGGGGAASRGGYSNGNGGGGGGYGTPGQTGGYYGASSNAGSGGMTYNDLFEVPLEGGSGGGGGSSAQIGYKPGISYGSNGGGGGAGGGTVHIEALGTLKITETGEIDADGGIGGKGVEGDSRYGGGAGGGSGGAIYLGKLRCWKMMVTYTPSVVQVGLEPMLTIRQVEPAVMVG